MTSSRSEENSPHQGICAGRLRRIAAAAKHDAVLPPGAADGAARGGQEDAAPAVVLRLAHVGQRDLGVDVEVIQTPLSIFCMDNY